MEKLTKKLFSQSDELEKVVADEEVNFEVKEEDEGGRTTTQAKGLHDWQSRGEDEMFHDAPWRKGYGGGKGRGKALLFPGYRILILINILHTFFIDIDLVFLY